MKPAHQKDASKGGRPPKFKEPRRPITVTLPERTLAQLAGIDLDRARAIVKVTDAMTPGGGTGHPSIEVVEAMPGTGVILVGTSRYLKQIPWLHLVHVAPGRFLLVIPTGTEPDSLEIALVDLLDDIPEREVHERKMVKDLQLLMRTFRHGRRVSKAELLFVNTERRPSSV